MGILREDFIKYVSHSTVILFALFSSTLSQSEDDLWDLSLEQLSTLNVFSAAKKPVSIRDTASAITVIRREDINISPAKNVPELLRTVPGLNFAQISASEWALSVRGLNSQFATQLLVLVDGRSIYDAFFSGVRWESEMPPLEDIDRIEVIRGPGGALWGANASNGIINIITKKANHKDASQLVTQLGEEIKEGTVSISGGSESVAWRTTAEFTQYDDSYVAFEPSVFSAKESNAANDQYYKRSFNTRADGALGKNQWTVTAGYNRASTHIELSTPSTAVPNTLFLNDGFNQTESYHIRASFVQPTSKGQERRFQIYHNDYEREDTDLSYEYQVLDLDYQESFQLDDTHQLLWGGNYRSNETSAFEGPVVVVTPADRDFHLMSLFFQVEKSLFDENAKVIVGAKAEDHDFTDTEFMPSIKALWHYHDKHTVWASLARAVREPSPWNLDRNIFLTFIASPDATSIEALPGDDVEAEEVTTTELGFRGEFSDTIGYDVTLFYSDYEDRAGGGETQFAFQLAGTQSTSVFVSDVNRFVIGTPPASNNTLISYGFESAVNVKTGPNSSIVTSFSYLDIDSSDMSFDERSPDIQLVVDATRKWGDDFTWASVLRYVDEIEVVETKIDSYVELDLRLQYNWRPDVSVSVIGKNLLDSSHPEFFSSNRNRPDIIELERSVYLRADYSF